jgi:peptide deformylase
MTQLTILRYPDPRLHTVAKPVADVNQRLSQLVSDMFETMYEAAGIGLAATQVDVHERLIVIDVSEKRDEPMVLINPELVWLSEETRLGEEGCLSVPGFFESVKRSEHIRVKALDKFGQHFELEAQDLLAVCIQHEMDHLDGKLFVDYLSTLKRHRIKAKLQKIQRLEKNAS